MNVSYQTTIAYADKYNIICASILWSCQDKWNNIMLTLASEKDWCYGNLLHEVCLGSPFICNIWEQTKVSSNMQSPHKHSLKPWVSVQLHSRTPAPPFTCSNETHIVKSGWRRSTKHLMREFFKRKCNVTSNKWTKLQFSLQCYFMFSVSNDILRILIHSCI